MGILTNNWLLLCGTTNDEIEKGFFSITRKNEYSYQLKESGNRLGGCHIEWSLVLDISVTIWILSEWEGLRWNGIVARIVVLGTKHSAILSHHSVFIFCSACVMQNKSDSRKLGRRVSVRCSYIQIQQTKGHADNHNK